MAFTLKDIVPWGRSFEEYCSMFKLSPDDLQKRILGCGDGPAGFNAGFARRGGRVVSADPVYRFTAEDISRRIDETYCEVMEQTVKNRDEFVWKSISSPEELGRIRMRAMGEFLSDFDAGRRRGRYVAAELPRLPFGNNAFDIALCSHLLFLYSERLSLTFHMDSIEELCRVAKEARVFPLLELGARRSRHLDAVVEGLEGQGYHVGIEKVDYEFQRGGDEMMRVSK